MRRLLGKVSLLIKGVHGTRHTLVPLALVTSGCVGQNCSSHKGASLEEMLTFQKWWSRNFQRTSLLSRVLTGNTTHSSWSLRRV